MNIYVLKRLLEEGVKWNNGVSEVNGFELLTSCLFEGVYDEIKQVWRDQVGEFELVEAIQDRVTSNDVNIKYIFKVDGVLYALDAAYNSWSGIEMDTEDFYEVTPVEKTITVYKRVK